MKALLFALAALVTTTVACTGDDTSTPPIDAPAGLDGDNGLDAPPGTIDAPMACVLPTTSITCTDNTPCTAACAGAYCYNFQQVGMRCTNNCAGPADCPAGWSCNGMGRCRPPN